MFAFLAAIPASVTPLPPPTGSDIRAIVWALEARYTTALTLKATFLERYSEGPLDVRVESGTAYFSRPGRMRWEYESPETKLFVADGKTVWFYVPADRTVTRAPMKESTDWRTPLALLAGKAKLSSFCGRIEAADQTLATAGHPTGSAGGRVLLRCLPRRAAKDSFREALLEVDTARSDIVRVVVRRAGGVEIEYRFGNWQRNLPLPEVLFHFQAPAGVAIVEESSLAGPSGRSIERRPPTGPGPSVPGEQVAGCIPGEGAHSFGPSTDVVHFLTWLSSSARWPIPAAGCSRRWRPPNR